jgi:Uma2 family endonuclease
MDMESTAVRPRRRFTVEDYHRMGRAGILAEDDRVELIEGEIVEMPPIGSPHGGAVKTLNWLLSRVVGDRAIVAVQDPVVIGDLSEPQPDLMLLRPRADFYRTSHPEPEDVLLLVEVADTTGAYDRRVKLPLYARAGIAECWLVDLGTGAIEVHRSPSGETYEERWEVRPGRRLAPAAFPDAELEAGAILGSATS